MSWRTINERVRENKNLGARIIHQDEGVYMAVIDNLPTRVYWNSTHQTKKKAIDWVKRMLTD